MSLLKRLEAEKTEIKVVTDAKVSQKDPYQDTIHTIHREVIKEMDTEFLKLQGEEGQENAERIRQEIRKIAETVLDKETAVILRVNGIKSSLGLSMRFWVRPISRF